MFGISTFFHDQIFSYLHICKAWFPLDTRILFVLTRYEVALIMNRTGVVINNSGMAHDGSDEMPGIGMSD